ncbi:MAG: DUF4382 domain-containing protein [Dehalococcoidia bacterium]
MIRTFDTILDECVDRVNRGEKIEDCLAGYPEHAEELEPLLGTMFDTRSAYNFRPSAERKLAARQQFNAALGERERERAGRRPLVPRLLAWPAWAGAAAALAIVLIVYFGVSQGGIPIVPGPQPNPEGNFAFLISDEVNAIGDFQSLEVTVSKIGLLLGGNESQWIEIDPEVKTVDLTLLPGEKAQEIWRGNITRGQYTELFIYVENVKGVLLDGNTTTDVKLPSNKLRMSKPFSVTGDAVTSFIYDITVVEAGKSGKYNLKPQIGESGADQKFEKVEPPGQGDGPPKGSSKKEKDKDKEALSHGADNEQTLPTPRGKGAGARR